MKPIKFKCPRKIRFKEIEHEAAYYGSLIAGCPIHGRLLYNEIPLEVRDKETRWATLADIIKKTVEHE